MGPLVGYPPNPPVSKMTTAVAITSSSMGTLTQLVASAAISVASKVGSAAIFVGLVSKPGPSAEELAAAVSAAAAASRQAQFAFTPFITVVAAALLCIAAGLANAYNLQQSLKVGLRLFWPKQAHGVARNLVMVTDAFLSLCGFLLAALLPNGPLAFEVFCSCSATLAPCWIIACHFDYSHIALVVLFFSLVMPPALWSFECAGRQGVAVTLLVVSILKIDLLGGPVQFLNALAMLRRALRNGAFRRTKGLLWLFLCVKRKI